MDINDAYKMQEEAEHVIGLHKEQQQRKHEAEQYSKTRARVAEREAYGMALVRMELEKLERTYYMLSRIKSDPAYTTACLALESLLKYVKAGD